MKEETEILKCGREQDLIACIYGELNESATRTFMLHAKDCSECSLQLSEFRSIRESLVDWRNESLGFTTSVANPAAVSDIHRPSAFAAIREFFNLSPLWLKGAVGFATLLFCLLAGLALTRLSDKPTPAVIVESSNNARAEQEFNAQVERRVQDELRRLKEEQPPAPVPTAENPAVMNQPRQMARANTGSKSRRPLSKTERQELAADLRLIESPADGELELLSDRVNQ